MLFVLGSFTACTSREIVPKMYINQAELTKEEKNIVNLMGTNLNNKIFDFTVDETIKAIQINTYKLQGDKWQVISGGGGHVLDDSEGRIALTFENIAKGMRTTLQSENTNSSVAHTIPTTDEFADMGRATSYLSNDTEIEYEKEIPLIIQISTTKNEISSYSVEYFNHPEEYQKLGYEYIYAVTVMFSQKTVNELDEKY
ncbi:MAG: hypothetical protein RR309_09685 [Cellulosilyticaceae bacterium]